MTAAGVQIGGMNVDDAEQRLRAELAPRAPRPVAITVGSVPGEIDPTNVGALSATGRTAESVLCQAKMQRRPDVPPSPMAGRYSLNAC